MPQMVSNIVEDKSLSQILANARVQRERLGDILNNIRDIRVQLDGDFPTAESDKKLQQPLPGLIGAVISMQASEDEIIEEINNHISAIHNLLGTRFHPNCEDDKETS